MSETAARPRSGRVGRNGLQGVPGTRRQVQGAPAPTWNTGAGAQNMRKLGAAQGRFRQRLEQVQLHGAGGTASPHAAPSPSSATRRAGRRAAQPTGDCRWGSGFSSPLRAPAWR